MRLLTGSKAALALRCSYWLREKVEHAADTYSLPALEGTALHSAFEGRIRGSFEEPFGELPAESQERVRRKLLAFDVWFRAQGRLGWRAEVAYAYDPATDVARELEQESHRDYSGAQPGDICMQLDVVTLGADDAGPYVEVIDFKTGRTSGSVEAQLALGALAWSRVAGVERARVRAVYVSEEGVHEDVALLEAFDLDGLRRRLVRVVSEPDAAPKPGPWCTDLYCPARARCPATVQALASLTDQPVADVQRLVSAALVTPADAGRAYVQLRVIKDAVKAVDERIRELVELHGSAPTPGGKVLRVVTTSRESFSRARLPKDRAEEVLGLLRDVGALSESTSSYVRESAK